MSIEIRAEDSGYPNGSFVFPVGTSHRFHGKGTPDPEGQRRVAGRLNVAGHVLLNLEYITQPPEGVPSPIVVQVTGVESVSASQWTLLFRPYKQGKVSFYLRPFL